MSYWNIFSAPVHKIQRAAKMDNWACKFSDPSGPMQCFALIFFLSSGRTCGHHVLSIWPPMGRGQVGQLGILEWLAAFIKRFTKFYVRASYTVKCEIHKQEDISCYTQLQNRDTLAHSSDFSYVIDIWILSVRTIFFQICLVYVDICHICYLQLFVFQ